MVPPGKKVCPMCNAFSAIRSFSCKECGHSFYSKEKLEEMRKKKESTTKKPPSRVPPSDGDTQVAGKRKRKSVLSSLKDMEDENDDDDDDDGSEEHNDGAETETEDDESVGEPEGDDEGDGASSKQPSKRKRQPRKRDIGFPARRREDRPLSKLFPNMPAEFKVSQTKRSYVTRRLGEKLDCSLMPDGKSTLALCAAAVVRDSVHYGFTGGSTWAMDWCPDTRNDAFLAIAPHPLDEPHHKLGVSVDGDAVVQIWRAGSDQVSCAMVFAVSGSSFITCMRWCPGCEANPEEGRLGILAVALGNGVVSLFSVPHPNAIPDGDQPCVLDLSPVVSTAKANRLPLTVGWGVASANAELLAVGSDKGDVAIYAFSEASEETAEACYVFSASVQALRAVEWSPAEPWVLATAGHDGHLRIWNICDACFPIACKTVTRGWILCAQWYESTKIMYGTDASILQCWNLLDNDTTLATYKAAVWGVTMQDAETMLSATADGRVQTVPILLGEDRKKKRLKKTPKIQDIFTVSLRSKSKEDLHFGYKHDGHADPKDGFDATGIAWHAVACSSISGDHLWRAAVGSAGVLAVQKVKVSRD